MRALLFLCLAYGLVAADPAYEPALHPMPLLRQISGFTQPVHTLVIAAEESGRIAQVHVEAGVRVPQGEAPVVQLDAVLADQAIAVAAAQVAARRAEWSAGETDAGHSLRDAERIAALSAQGSVSASANDVAQRDRDRAQGNVAVAAANLAVSEAALVQAQERRRRLDLRAPPGWVVTSRFREPGALVQAGEAILTLADTSELLVPLRLDEVEIAALRAAASLSLTIGGVAVPAAIRRVDVTFDAATRKRLVELVVAGRDLTEASGGLEAALELALPDPAGGLLVPSALVAWRLERPWGRTTDGRDLPLTVLRKVVEGLVVAPAPLPAGVLLVAP